MAEAPAAVLDTALSTLRDADADFDAVRQAAVRPPPSHRPHTCPLLCA